MPAPQDSITQLNQCLPKTDPSACRALVTASSVALYNRFVSYDLLKCLPQPVTYVSQEHKGAQTIIRSSVMVNGTQRFLRLIYVEEEGKWKLDIPESLHLSMGNNWEKQVNMTEQIYVMLKQQMGEQFSCNTLLTLVKPKQPSAAKETQP